MAFNATNMDNTGDYGFYCDLEEEPTYTYEVVEYTNCYKVVRKQSRNIQIEDVDVKTMLEPRENHKNRNNMYVLSIFIISSLYLLFA